MMRVRNRSNRRLWRTHALRFRRRRRVANASIFTGNVTNNRAEMSQKGVLAIRRTYEGSYKYKKKSLSACGAV